MKKKRKRKKRGKEVERITEDLGKGAKRHKLLHKSTGEYYFVCWEPIEPYGEIGITTYEQGTLADERWQKVQRLLIKKGAP